MAGAAGRVSASAAIIWHNPRCSKSRAVLALLRDAGVEPAVRAYLTDPPSRGELEGMIARAGLSPREALRADAPRFAGDAAALDAMAADPELIERPFVSTPRGAALCRPPERVLALLEK